jgi:hypothetical protein
VFDEYMPRPYRQDASLGWVGLLASIVVTFVLVRVGVSISAPTMIGPRNSIAVLIRGEGTVEAAAEGPSHTPYTCSQAKCTFSFPSDAKEVVITYQPRAGSSFQSWGGACIGSDTWCHIGLGEYKVITVSFYASGAPPIR